MNKAYRLIWNSAKETWTVVAETVKSCGTMPSLVVGSVALMAAVLCGAVPASALDPGALPTGGQIVAGAGSIATTGSAMTVTQTTQRMVANWNSFNIGQNASVAFQQPNAASVALNRIADQNPSQIMGSLSANGQVFLLNPSGIIFGQTAQVNVGALVASSLNITNDNFMAGKLAFEKVGAAGAIINQGSIRTADGGYVAFLAPQVTNEGSITATKGSVLLAAADKVSLDFTGDGLLSYSVEQGAVDALAANKGLIKADGGLVVMTAQAADSLTSAVVNNEGTIEAQTIENKAGRILLLADMDNGLTTVSGTLDASAPNGGDGGFIETSGHSLNITGGAVVKAKDWLLDPANITISSSASTGDSVSGTTYSPFSGNWTTTIQDTVLETALNAGTSITVTTINNGIAGGSVGDITVAAPIDWTGASKLTLRADHNIYINENITATNAAGQLALYYGQSVVAAGNTATYIIASGKTVNLQAGDNFFTKLGSDGVEKTYTVITALGAAGSTTSTDLQGINGNLTKNYVLGTDIAASTTSTWNVGDHDANPGTADVAMGFAPIGPYVTAFDGLGHTITGVYINTPAYNQVGLFAYAKTGSAIRNLILKDTTVRGNDQVGGIAGKAINAVLENVHITGTSSIVGDDYIGGLIGDLYSGGEIIDSSSSASVTGDSYVGGLVGAIESYSNPAYIKAVNGTVFATGSVTGVSNVGGLVGDASDVTFQATAFDKIYAANTVTGYDRVGGLVGASAVSTYTYVNASGTLQRYDYGETTYSYFGGLIGYSNHDTINHAKTTGATINLGTDASTYEKIGGLIGYAYRDTINNSFSTVGISLNSASTGNTYIGGLVGKADTGGVTSSYASGVVSASNTTYAGGLIGYTFNFMINSSYATGAVTGNSKVGGLVGGLDGGLDGSLVRESYSVGLVTPVGASPSNVNGLIGLKDDTSVVYAGSYYDKTINSTLTENAYNVGKTTTELKTLATFSTWTTDGEPNIVLDSSLSNVYPQLRWATSGLSAGTSTWVIGSSTPTPDPPGPTPGPTPGPVPTPDNNQDQHRQQIIASITSHQQHTNGTQGDDENGDGQQVEAGAGGTNLGPGVGSGLFEGIDMGGLIIDRTGYRTNEEMGL